MTYDPVPFWNAYADKLAGPGAASPEHERQEAALERLLKPLRWATVLEVGVGGGRIAALLRRIRPTAAYAGLDIGTVQLDAGRRIWPDGDFRLCAIESFTPERTWDLVIASEVLMHVKPRAVRRAVRNVLAASSRHVVIVEWVPLPGELEANPTAPWNFPHDYEAMLPGANAIRTDRQVIYHIRKTP